MKKLYDIIWDEATNEISFEEITVLETSIVPGASLPTHKIRHADGKVARCSTDMYHATKKAALAQFSSNLSIALEQLDAEERRIADQRKKWRESLAIAQQLLEEKATQQYRCTRQKPYGPGCPGYTDTSARQGHYIEAVDRDDALAQMQELFPDEPIDSFTADLWKE